MTWFVSPVIKKPIFNQVCRKLPLSQPNRQAGQTEVMVREEIENLSAYTKFIIITVRLALPPTALSSPVLTTTKTLHEIKPFGHRITQEWTQRSIAIKPTLRPPFQNSSTCRQINLKLGSSFNPSHRIPANMGKSKTFFNKIKFLGKMTSMEY